MYINYYVILIVLVNIINTIHTIKNNDNSENSKKIRKVRVKSIQAQEPEIDYDEYYDENQFEINSNEEINLNGRL